MSRFMLDSCVNSELSELCGVLLKDSARISPSTLIVLDSDEFVAVWECGIYCGVLYSVRVTYLYEKVQ